LGLSLPEKLDPTPFLGRVAGEGGGVGRRREGVEARLTTRKIWSIELGKGYEELRLWRFSWKGSRQ